MSDHEARESCLCGTTFETKATYASTVEAQLDAFRRTHRHDVGISLECVDKLADRLAEALIARLDEEIPIGESVGEIFEDLRRAEDLSTCFHGVPFAAICDECGRR